MSELRARARVLYNALNFDTPVNFGQEELFAKGLGEDEYVDSLHGAADSDLGNLEAARSAYRESLEITRRLAGTFPDQPRYQQDLAWIEARVAEQSN